MVQWVIEARELAKVYGKVRALDGFSLCVKPGNIFGLLGPNGAGKTTFIRTMLGFLKPTHGDVLVMGKSSHLDSLGVRRHISYLPAEAKLFGLMRGHQVLEFFAHLHPRGDLERAKTIAQQLDLDTSRRVAWMSTGMKQKLALAIALGNHAPLVILDEPTANLDPTVRFEVLRLIQQAKQQGQTLLFCSHVLDEIEEVCDHAAIVKKGRIVHEQDMHDMRALYRLRATLPSNHGNTEFRYDLKASLIEGVSILSREDDRIVLSLEGDLDRYWTWLSQQPFTRTRLEPFGLRSIYEQFHGREDA